jgi:hypothetical protein
MLRETVVRLVPNRHLRWAFSSPPRTRALGDTRSFGFADALQDAALAVDILKANTSVEEGKSKEEATKRACWHETRRSTRTKWSPQTWAHLNPHFHNHGDICGEAVFYRGPLRGCAHANPNHAALPTTTVTSAAEAFGRTRCYWRTSPASRNHWPIRGAAVTSPHELHAPSRHCPGPYCFFDQIFTFF